MTADRTPPSLLIFRTWREDGSDRPFRAQIRIAMDVSSGSAAIVNVADPDRALAIIRAFLTGEPVPWARGDEGHASA